MVQAEAGFELPEVGGPDNNSVVWNDTDLDTQHVMSEFYAQADPQTAALVRWTQSARSRRGNMFDRDRYVTPNYIWDQFRTAQHAAENDDIVSGVLETTEALAFGRMTIEVEDDDEANIWAQIAVDIDLDARIREMWREDFIMSQFYCAIYEGVKTYKVSGKGEGGRTKRKVFENIKVPIGVTMLDPCKIVPCLPADALVWTIDGPVRMEDVQVGDEVWSFKDGHAVQRAVTSKVATGTKAILRIHTRNHTLRVTSNHLLLCLERDQSQFCPKNIRFGWKEASAITTTDVLVGLKDFPEEFQVGESCSADYAYILGLASGDGGRNKKMGSFRASSEDRFWSKVQRNDPNDCWPWKAETNRKGYPCGFNVERKSVLPHRYSWFLMTGADPGGALKRLCETPVCVNPSHFVEKEETQPNKSRSMKVMPAVPAYSEFRLYPATGQADDWTAHITKTLPGCSVSRYDHSSSDECKILRFASPELAPWALFMRDHCTEKRMPAWLWRAPRDVRLAFLRGFLESDGSREYPARAPKSNDTKTWKWRLENRWLAEDARMLAISVGWGVTDISEEWGSSQCDGVLLEGMSWFGHAYEGTMKKNVPTSFDCYGKFDLDEHLLARTVTEIVEEPAEPVWDIQVEDSHCFIAEGLVVHNCGNTLFNQDQLAYSADTPELDVINAVINGQRDLDPVIGQILVRPYDPDIVERTQLAELGLPTGHLFLLDSRRVFRHTATRPQYKRFADVRMKTIFELLDLKAQLRELDRAMLLGSTQYLIVVTRGTDKLPATQPEIRDTEARFRVMARVPVIVGDHRLKVEIVQPHSDFTLDVNRWDTLDSRITIRLFSLFIAGKMQTAARGDDSIKLARVIGRSLESRRHMIKKTIEQRILRPVFERNPQFTQMPELRFHPKHIALDLDPALLNYLLDIRDRGDLSRETLLEQIDVSQDQEFLRRKAEKDMGYDEVFQTQVPGAPVNPANGSPPTRTKTALNKPKPVVVETAPVDPKAAGRRGGGNRNGGGAGRTGAATREAGKPAEDAEADD